MEAGFACVYMDRLRFADFKQRRELEQARDELRELDQAKSRFSANIHHELRTPLTLILAPLQALRSGEFGTLSRPVSRSLETMYANGQRLFKMINSLLDLAKLESRQFEIHRLPLDLGRLIDELVEGAGALAQRKEVELSSSGLAVLPKIYADPEAMEKVVVNLLGNALKFTEAGGRVEIWARALDDGIEICVEDTGVGIPVDKLDVIFDRFAQVDTSATRRHEGTGIGLSLVRELVEMHGGRIRAESEGFGRGSRMVVVLPKGEWDGPLEDEVLVAEGGGSLGVSRSLELVEAELQSEAGSREDRFVADSASESELESRSELTRPVAVELPADAAEVLVAEDNPDMRSLLRFLLSREFRVRTACNGREALEQVRERMPDLILTDVMMPEMSGTELCREIKGDPALRGLPVVLVTAKAESEMQIEGLELGADDYVTKPFHPRELLARVRSLVLLRRLQQELAVRNAELVQAFSDLRQAEVRLVQSERLSAVGELAAGVAHEINNPVNFALNAARALEGSFAEVLDVVERAGSLEPDDAAKLSFQATALRDLAEEMGLEDTRATLSELVGIVSEGLKRTHRIVAELRDFAAPDRGMQANVDVRKCIRSTAELLRHALQEARAELELSLPDTLPLIRADSGALNQVFLNLLKNAAEAMEGRGGRIEVELCAQDAEIRIEIRDDGPGIAPEAMERLFEPFFTTKEEGKGTGLGLSMSRQIVAGHEGSLEVKSVPGEGATFIVRLPVDGGRESEHDT
ncbi:MAG: response regulator [Deltaproteobacteria bacterium]|nr:response regulator [Deltaproteobacteria bacterium]